VEVTEAERRNEGTLGIPPTLTPCERLAVSPPGEVLDP
jgi:hypothetical protein